MNYSLAFFGSPVAALGYAVPRTGLERHCQLSTCMPDPSQLVLCVDDERVGLAVRQLLLERAGYRVLIAQDGPAGLALFEREPVNVVVLDYSMPGMHGGEVALRMRAAKPAVPILMLSAYLSLPSEVTATVDVAMTKGEGAEALLDRLQILLAQDSPASSHSRPERG